MTDPFDPSAGVGGASQGEEGRRPVRLPDAWIPSAPSHGEVAPEGLPSRASSRARRPGSVPLSILLPGLPQLLAGRRGAGTLALALWTGLLCVLVTRWERVLGALTGGWEERLALATLLLGLAGAWAWSLRETLRVREASARPLGTVGWVRDFGRNGPAVVGSAAVIAVCVAALLAPFLAPWDPTLQGDLLTHRFLPPTTEHLLGTDQFARDVLSRLLYGARISLFVGATAVAIAVTIGTVLGAVAGFVGGRVDGLIMRFVDVVIAFPRLVLLVAVVALFEASILLIVVLLGVTQWPQAARLVRGEVLGLREKEFVLAGVALGFSRTRILLGHVLPNAWAPVIVAATLGVGDAIILEAGLSFLGLGVQPPTPSWGTMVADGRGSLLDAWWISTFPGLAIVLVVVGFNLAGDGLRDALDPRLRS